jgi:uncharacterized protein involved in outer membrane biogenesis
VAEVEVPLPRLITPKLTTRLAYGLGGLLALAVAAAFVVPHFIDWNRYRGDIAVALSTATGRDIAIRGDVDLSVLPVPTLRARDVRIGNVPGGTAPDFARIGAFEIRLSILPLVAGRIEAKSVSLVKPDIELEILASGEPNWRLERVDQGADRVVRRSGIAMRFETVSVEGATISYRSAAAGHQLTLNKVDATIDATGEPASYRARGQLHLGAVPLGFEASIEPPRDNGLVPLRLTLRHGRSARGELDGYLESPPEALRLAGTFRANGDHFAELFSEAEGATLPAWLAGKFTFDSAVTLAGAQLSFTDATLQLEQVQGKGAVAVALGASPRVDATLTLNRLDVDKLLEPELKRAAAAPAPAPPPAAAVGSGAARPATPPVVVALPTLEMPRWPRLTLNLTVDALVYRREIIRNLRASGTLADGKLDLYGLTAQLPGSADLAVSGTLTAVDRRPKFDGPVTLNASNLRGVLDWLGIDASRVSAGRLRTLDLSGKLAVDPATIRLVDAAMNLDLSRATGSIGLRLGAEPTALADLTIDRLDVGAYWPRPRPAPAAPAKPEAAKSGEAKSDNASVPAPLPSWRGPVDAELQLSVGTLVADGNVLREARFRGVLAKDSLTIERATFQDYQGLKGGVTGTVRQLSQHPLLNLSFDVQAAELIDVVRLAGVTPPSTLAHAGPTLIRGTVKGDPDKLAVTVRADAARGTLSVDGTVAPPTVNPHFDLGVEIKHPDASDLLPLLAGMVPPGVDLEGPAAFATHLKGDLGRIDFSDLHLLLNKTEVVGAGSLELARLRPRLVARFDSGPLTLDQLFALPAVLVADNSPGVRAPEKTGWSNEPLDLSGFARLDAELEIRPKAVSLGAYRLDDAEVRMTLADGALELSRVSGKLFGGELVGKASAGGGKTPHLRAAFAVTKADLGEVLRDSIDSAPIDGALDLEVDLETTGGSVRGLVTGLTGTARLAAHEGTIQGFDLAHINDRIEATHESVGLLNLLQEGMSNGRTTFKALAGSFDIKGGVARTKDLKLDASGGTGTASGSLDLSSRTVDATADFRLSAVPDAPPFRVVLNGVPGALRAVFQFNELQQFLLKRGKPG